MLGLLLVLLAPAGSATAHAILLRAEPGIGESVVSSPSVVNLWFSEGLEVDPDGVQVVDAAGARYDLQTRVSQESVQQTQTSVKPLPQGVYTVRWRITSIDTHVISGSFQFGVGTTVAGGAAQTLSGTTSLFEAGLRWLSLTAMAVLIGGFWFHLLVLRRLSPLPVVLQQAPGSLLRAMRVAALALLLLNLIWVGYQILLVSDSGPGALLDPEAISKVVMRSRFGTIWLGRMVCVIALLGIVDQLETQWRANGGASRWWWLGLPVGAALALTATLLGHAAAEDMLWLSVSVNWLHLTATAIWLGGVIHFALLGGSGMVRAETGQRLAAVAALWPHFSKVAILGVQVVVATGLLSAWLLLGRLDFFASTDYGRTLLIKLALVAPLLGIGAVNLLRYGPWLERHVAGQPAERDDRLFGSTVTSLRGEALLGVGVLALAGLLGATAPPYDGGSVPADSASFLAPVAPQRGLTLAQGAATTLIVMNLTPGGVGPNNLRIALRDAGGQDVTGGAVQVRVSTPGGSGASLVTLEPATGGYRGVVQLSEAAEWTFEVLATPPGTAEERAEFSVRVPLPTPTERLAQANRAMNKLTSHKEQQVLRGASNQAVTYDYQYVAPGRMRATATDGSEVVLIGSNRYTRTGGEWSKTQVPTELAYKFPDYDFTLGADRVADLGIETVDGVPTSVLAFEQSGSGFYYRLWLDSDNLVRRIKMMGPSHFMDATLSDFNAPITIEAPIP